MEMDKVTDGKMSKVRTQRSRIRSRTITLSKQVHTSGNSQHHIQVHVQQVSRQKTTTVSAPEVDKLKECLRLAMKERLWLERQLSFLTQNLHQLQISGDVNVVDKHVQLAKANKTLSQHVEFLSSLVRQQHEVEHELEQKQIQCQQLQTQLQSKTANCQQLTFELENAKEKNDELKTKSDDVQQELQQLQKQLSDVDGEKQSYEKEHNQLLNVLSQTKNEVNSLVKLKETEEQKSAKTIEMLQAQLKELEKRCELQKLKEEKMVLEMENLRHRQSIGDEANLTIDIIHSNDLNYSVDDDSSIQTNEYASLNYNLRPKSISQSALIPPEIQPVTRESSPVPKQEPSATNITDVKNLTEVSFIAGPTTMTIVNDKLEDIQKEVDKSDEDYITIPGIGRVLVYVAHYTYDPFIMSPNDNPEAELTVTAGDYILVYNDMDEDGFFDGQLLDGQKGLVPSNFVEKIIGDDLLYFKQNMIIDGNLINFASEVFNKNQQNILENCLPGDVICLTKLDNFDDADEFLIESENGPQIFFSTLVVPPQNLTVEHQFKKSILISWTPPSISPDSIDCYKIYVDGELKVTVPITARNRILLEKVNSLTLHRISVCSATINRRMSVDAACTAIVGKGAPKGPTCIQASSITSTSAIVSWLPSNSNFQHTIFINHVEVRLLKPGAFRHTITGLSPNTNYQAMVKANASNSTKDSKFSYDNTKSDSISIDFRTLPKGLPDPPLDVQVERGPEEGTLLISWLPVTINTSGTSNGSQVTGYSVYGDGQKVIDIDNPTSDHAIIETNKLSSIPTFMTVRTKSDDIVSSDSMQVQVSSLIVKGTQETTENLNKFEEQIKYKNKSVEETLVDKETTEKKDEESSGRSELSDIAEEAEDELSDSQNSSKKKIFLKQESHDIEKERQEKNVKIMNKTYKKLKKTIKTTDTLAMSVENYDHNHTRRPTAIPIFNHYSSCSKKSDQRRNSRADVSTDDNWSDEDLYPVSPKLNVPTETTSRWKICVDYLQKASIEKKQRQRTEETQRTRHCKSDRVKPEQNKSKLDDQMSSTYVIRTFEALFDYDPSTMSPNPGAFMDELPFREGQLIQIYGDKDPDGFYWGEVDGRQGLVPCNMVLEVQGERCERYNMKKVQSSWSKSSYKTTKRRSRSNSHEWNRGDKDVLVKKMVALYDYDPQKLSPNDDAEMELAFNTGDIIYVYGEMDEDGFYFGQKNDVCGLVPSNFLTEVQDDSSNNGLKSTPMRDLQTEKQNTKNCPTPCGDGKRW